MCKMDTELVQTGNNLLDIINWLKEGYIVCIHRSYRSGRMFYKERSLETIVNEEIIYVDVEARPDLLDRDEWPAYIKDAGFCKYKSTNVLPTKEHHFKL